LRIAEKNYRPDIDGMRGFSALIVVIFHLNKDYIPGGMCAITWFFVCSGYLITRNIVHDLESDKFTFSHFYLRRVRRLFPAHIVVLFLTLLVGTCILSPADLMEMGKSSVAVSLFSGNIFFATVTGYFDSDVYQKPLLHTWSLSLEEQYYFIWPFLVVLFLRFKSSFFSVSFLLFGIVLSLLLASWMSGQNPQAAYYLLPSRMFEFMAGSLMVWLVPYRIKSKLILELMGVLALAAIILPLFFYRLDTIYPGVAVIVPVVAICLLIYTGPRKLTGRIFNNSFFIAGGLISYSLYLVHWPIITLYKYYFVIDVLALHEQVILMAVAIFSASLIYHYVETPFRFSRNTSHDDKRLNNKLFVISTIWLTAASAILGASIYKGNGWTWRVPIEVRNAVVSAERTTNEVKYGRRECHLDKRGHIQPYFDRNKNECLKLMPGKRNYLLIGDSTAAMLYHGLSKTFPDINFMQTTSAHCQPMLGATGKVYTRPGNQADLLCELVMSYIYDEFLPTNPSIDRVIIATRISHDPYWAEKLRSTIGYLQSIGQTPLFVLQGRKFDSSVPQLLQHAGSFKQANRILEQHRFKDNSAKINLTSIRVLEEMGVPYIDSLELLCPGGSCVNFYNSAPLYNDDIHFTNEGTIFFAEKVRDNVSHFAE
jgi:peptidoglycan/LPS O-acetylase OafA/YrhL